MATEPSPDVGLMGRMGISPKMRGHFKTAGGVLNGLLMVMFALSMISDFMGRGRGAGSAPGEMPMGEQMPPGDVPGGVGQVGMSGMQRPMLNPYAERPPNPYTALRGRR